MFDMFAAGIQLLPPGQVPGQVWRDDRLTSAAGYFELASAFAGCTFEDGLYRLHDAATGPLAEAWIAESFPQFAGRACPFGYDWLGRQFALDSVRIGDGEPLVLLIEPGTGEALEVPFSFSGFHQQLAELKEPALAGSFFDSWVQANPQIVPLAASQCVGYKIPLFLGGKDTLDNLEVTDLEVYWSLSGQLRAGTRTLPPGTSISQVKKA